MPAPPSGGVARIYLARQMAAPVGVSQAVVAKRMRLSFCRVAEFQGRDVVHLHAMARGSPSQVVLAVTLGYGPLRRGCILQRGRVLADGHSYWTGGDAPSRCHEPVAWRGWHKYRDEWKPGVELRWP
jgi:hypothetical protein